MPSKMIILRANGTREERDCPPVYEGQDNIRHTLRDIVDGDIEHVTVLHNEKRTYMVVNETGACEIGGPVLPVNKEATKIYWRYSIRNLLGLSEEEYAEEFERRFGIIDALGTPAIHGDAVILEDVEIR